MSKSVKNKYKMRPSPPYPAQERQNEILMGNDGNKYISLPDKNGIYKWKKYVEGFDFTELEDFEINVNNSVLVTKDDFECKIKGNKFYLKLSNELIPEIDKLIIDIPFDKISENLFIETNNPKYSFIQLFYKNLYIQISFSYSKSDKQLINFLSNLPSNGKYFSIDTIPHNKIHHYGEMIILNIKNLRELKPGNRYVIVYGNIWDIDYAGFSSLAVFDYKGFYYDKYMKEAIVDGIVYVIENNKLIQYNASEFMATNVKCKEDDCYFGYGDSHDPVHLIIQFRKDIKLHDLFKRI